MAAPPSDFIPFPTMDAGLAKATLSSPPFVQVEGIFNIRDFGAGYPAATGRVKSLHLFRSGEPTRISPKGIEQLKSLGIKKIFDLRADIEIAKYKTATPEIEGVEIVRASILEETLDPVGLAAKCVYICSFQLLGYRGRRKGSMPKEG